MHILIAGGTGTIGQRLVNTLLSEGHAVTILTRRVQNSEDFSSHVRQLSWDGKHPVDLDQLAQPLDAVVNLCGEGIADKRWNQRRESVLSASRLEPTEAIVQSILNMETKPEVLIQASAVGYYCSGNDQKLDENASSDESFLSRLCQDWEAAGLQVTDAGVRCVIIRTGIVLDPNGGALSRMLPPFQFFIGGPLGSGRQWFPWIHYKDEVRAILHCIQNKDIQGSVNVASPYPLTNKEFSQELASALSRPCWLPVPALALKVIFGDMSTVLLDGQRVWPRKLEESGFQFLFPEAETALKDLLTED